MIKVSVKKQSNFSVDTRKIKKFLADFFGKQGIVSDSEVSVVFVGEEKMLDISKKYLKDATLHDVLSFTEDEVKNGFVYPPDGLIHLGEIVVCYPEAIKEANSEGKLIDVKISELVEHGAMHLLGLHHEL